MECVETAPITAEEQAFANGYSAGYAAGRRSAGLQVEWVHTDKQLPECEEEAETGPLFFVLRDGNKIEAGYFGAGGVYRDRYFRTYRDTKEGYDAADVALWAWQPPLPEVY